MRRFITGLVGSGFRGTVLGLFVCLLAVRKANGDIYEWVYSGPDGSVIQSSTVCPGGSGVSAVPGADLSLLNLTQAYLVNADLTNANLTNAYLYEANLTNANLTGATVVGASFLYTNLTASQLYSTASYQAKNLQGIVLGSDVLTGWDLSGQNLTNASFNQTEVTNVNLTGAIVTGADFWDANLTDSQLYSTASYQAKNLQGIRIRDLYAPAWNFSGQNLTSADLSHCNLTNSNLTGANLSNAVALSSTLTNANLTNANLSYGTLTNANFAGADLRGAIGFSGAAAITTNTILPNGTIQGLTLDPTNSMLFVRNYSGSSSIPIHIQQGVTLSQSGSLVLEFDGNPWGSTISFDPGIPVALGGNLELDVVAGVNPANLVGDSFQAFDRTGVNPAGEFASITNDLPAGYSWDTSQLYTTGNVTLVPEPSTVALLVAGAVGLVGYGLRRRRKKRVAPALTGD